MISQDTIDRTLLLNIGPRWQKLALVVGKTMVQIDKEDRRGLNDLYFASGVKRLIESGMVEYSGDIENMRNCEVRLSVK